MTRTHSSLVTLLFTALTVLALAGAMLFLLIPSAEAQEGSVPTQPQGLTAEASHDRIVLAWDDPGDGSIDGYVILRRIRGVDPQGQFSTHVADTGTAETGYTDTRVEPETPYTYRIKAINEHGTSKRSRWVHIDTPAAPPAAPTGLAAAASHDSVILTWTDPQDDTITGYRIERRDLSEGEGAQFSVLSNDTSSAAASYTDNTVEPETRYEYRVQALSPQGDGELSGAVPATTPAAPKEEEPPTGERANVSEPDGEDLPANEKHHRRGGRRRHGHGKHWVRQRL